MPESHSFKFRDDESGDEVYCVIRAFEPEGIILAVSLKSDGDYQVVVPPEVADRLASGIRQLLDEQAERTGL